MLTTRFFSQRAFLLQNLDFLFRAVKESARRAVGFDDAVAGDFGIFVFMHQVAHSAKSLGAARQFRDPLVGQRLAFGDFGHHGADARLEITRL